MKLIIILSAAFFSFASVALSTPAEDLDTIREAIAADALTPEQHADVIDAFFDLQLLIEEIEIVPEEPPGADPDAPLLKPRQRPLADAAALEKMRVKDLKELAESIGIEPMPRRKEDIISAIKKAQK